MESDFYAADRQARDVYEAPKPSTVRHIVYQSKIRPGYFILPLAVPYGQRHRKLPPLAYRGDQTIVSDMACSHFANPRSIDKAKQTSWYVRFKLMRYILVAGGGS